VGRNVITRCLLCSKRSFRETCCPMTSMTVKTTPPKCWYTFSKTHGIISQNIFNFDADLYDELKCQNNSPCRCVSVGKVHPDNFLSCLPSLAPRRTVELQGMSLTLDPAQAYTLIQNVIIIGRSSDRASR